MKFSLIVHAEPYATQASASAYAFAQAVLRQGHSIHRVFFYRNGVHNASALIAPPQDEQNLPLLWQSLAQDNHVELIVCIAAALRRGILNNTEAQRYQKPAANLISPFILGGLGQLLEAAVESDRLVSFGA